MEIDHGDVFRFFAYVEASFLSSPNS